MLDSRTHAANAQATDWHTDRAGIPTGPARTIGAEDLDPSTASATEQEAEMKENAARATSTTKYALDQRLTPYADALTRLARRDTVQLMVPGHEGDTDGISSRLAEFIGEKAVGLDFPMLLDGVDLGEDSPFDETVALAADAWGAKRTWFMTNGASQANRTAALAVRGLGTSVVSQRNAHSSFSDGVLLGGLTPTFVQPSIDFDNGIAHGVTPAALEEALGRAQDSGESPAAVYVVSPSYFGSVADVAALAEVAHAHDTPLIVDNAWGPHFGFHPALPESPARLGADLVISSTHKLAGSLTQSAMLHLGHGPFADRLEPMVERAHMMTASTSSSALLMGSLDVARSALACSEASIGASIEASEHFRELLRSDSRFSLVSDRFDTFADIAAIDPLRVPIDLSATGLSAHWVRDQLIKDHDLYFEMSTDTTLVAVIGAGKVPDFDAVFANLVATIESPAAEAQRRTEAAGAEFPHLPTPGPTRMLARDGYFAQTELVPAAEAVGRISADTLAAYPPGVPNVLPGEELTDETVDFLVAVAASPIGYVRGAADKNVSRFRVVVNS